MFGCARSDRGVAPVNQKQMTVDEVRPRAGQEHGRTCHIRGVTDSAGGDLGHEEVEEARIIE